MRILWSRYYRLIITLLSAVVILLGTLLAIQFAKGYRPNRQGVFQGTGLLSLSSVPTNALVYINGVLSNTVTNDTLNLEPGEYEVRIVKDGFTPWTKRLQIERELVTATDAHLFRTVPSLTPLTFAGATNIVPAPNGEKLSFSLASPSGQLKEGLYLLELTDRPQLFSPRGSQLIADTPRNSLSYDQAELIWSPNSTQILASFPSGESYLVDTRRFTRRTELIEISDQVELLLTSWEQEMRDRDKQLFSQLPKSLQSLLLDKASNVYFSPDANRVLYTPLEAFTIEPDLIPALPSRSTQPETRAVNPGNVYVYDIKEDRNYLVYTPKQIAFNKPSLVSSAEATTSFTATATISATPQLQAEQPEITTLNFRGQYSSFPYLPFQWFPTSSHLLITEDGTIAIVEYDGTNNTSLYSGLFTDNFVYPWPNGDKLIILTNLTLNPGLPANLYTINLK